MNKLRFGIYVLTVIFVLSGCNSSKNLSRDSSEVSRDTLESEIIENSVEDSFPKSFIENISGIKGSSVLSVDIIYKNLTL